MSAGVRSTYTPEVYRPEQTKSKTKKKTMVRKPERGTPTSQKNWPSLNGRLQLEEKRRLEGKKRNKKGKSSDKKMKEHMSSRHMSW